MIKPLILSVGLLLSSGASLSAQAPQTKTTESTTKSFSLITLPYATSALAPAINQSTIELHHGKHLQAYVNNLNKLRVGTAFERVDDLEQIVRESKGSIFDNAGQILNHNLYFLQFKPGGSQPSGRILDLIREGWGSFEAFQKSFEAEGMKLFGSGWLWLVQHPCGKLAIVREANGSNPIVNGLTPLLGVDLWEHAYYLDYQNRRADHLKALWGIYDWAVIGSRLTK